MLKSRVSRAVSLAAAFFLLAQTAFAGVLGDFEKDATKDDQTEQSSRHKHGHHDDDSSSSSSDSDGSEVAEAIVAVLLGGFVYGGMESWYRATGTAPETHGNVSPPEPRPIGSALIPILRVDLAYQPVEHHVDALDVLAQVGYGPVAAQVRHTSYWEGPTSDTMSQTQVHALYRMSFGSHFETDLGFGALVLDGKQTTSGFSFTMPVLIHPSPNFGLEFRPSWSDLNGNTIEDYDMAVLMGAGPCSLKLGYRWFMSENVTLKGPEVGLSVRW
ncbi:hypothetical protein L4X63_02940 [Geomonas sp. Red32]|uniref:hypothetical protein n=1 Tax=Geomonas sp. Red32 TaxID=2912856 RepID=UPI00202CE47D|nr:hypothetical protein [Geomonas sp. Red32]MCM0080538.1 hypothetical protein [Geomonas sp. Red32]